MSNSRNHKKNHKLIKMSCQVAILLLSCLGREFFIVFIDMHRSQSRVVCDFPQVSASDVGCGWDLYKYRTNSSRQSSNRSCRPERFFHAPCPERISKMTKSPASMSSLMVNIVSPTYLLVFKIIKNQI